jgi:hypothetical protein|tara:strand:- start:171 stop:359 length:189 start_codon:yes stop_codon:yes gene_type:complete
MIEGDIVRLKGKYPIWLYSLGHSNVGLGIITKVEEEEVIVYWLKIGRIVNVRKNLVEVAKQD